MNISDPNNKRWGGGLDTISTRSNQMEVGKGVNAKIAELIKDLLTGKGSFSLTRIVGSIAKIYTSALLSHVSKIYLQQKTPTSGNLQSNPLKLMDSSERVNDLKNLIFNNTTKKADVLEGSTSHQQLVPSNDKASIAKAGIADQNSSQDTIKAGVIVKPKPTLENMLQEAHTLRSYIESNDLQDLTAPNVPHNQNEELLSVMADHDPGIFDFMPTLFMDSKPAALVLIPREIRKLSDFNPNFAHDSDFLKKLEVASQGTHESDKLAETVKPKTVAEPTLADKLKKEASTLRSYVESNDLQDLTAPDVPNNENETLLSAIADQDPGIFDFMPTLFKDSKPAALVLVPRDIRKLSDFNADFAKDLEFINKLELSTKNKS